jgi:hypothetical protein
MATASPFRFFQLRRLTRAVAISLTALLFGGPAFGQTVAELQPQVSIKVKKDGGKITVEVIPDKRIIEQTTTDAGGKVTEKTVCPLDDRNLAMGAVHYDAKGNVWYKETFHRDASDRVTQINYTGSDGRALGKRVFSFQGDKIVSKEDYDADGNLIVPAAATPRAKRH